MALAWAYGAEARLAVRALTAAALSYFIGEALALPQSYWAVITAIIIIQGSIGGTLSAGIDRLVGTLAGAVLGAAAALTREVLDVPPLVLLLVAVAPLAFLAALRPSFRIAPVTATIVLLSNAGAASPIAAAMHRVIEIALGTVVGIVVSMTVLPSRARRICFEQSAEMLGRLAQILALHLQPPVAERRDAVERLSEQVRAALRNVGTAAQEARHEHVIRMAGEPVPDRLVRTLRRLRSDVAFVGRATAAEDLDWQALGLALGEVTGVFCAAFEALAETLRHGKPPPDLGDVGRAVATLLAVIGDGADAPVTARAAAVLPFVIDTLRRDLGDLADALAPPVAG